MRICIRAAVYREGSASRRVSCIGGGGLPTREGVGQTPPGTRKADGTHPTGMPSCVACFSYAWFDSSHIIVE